MYAVMETGGMQFKVEPGMKLSIPRVDTEEGGELNVDRVLLLSDGDDVRVGTPLVDGASVRLRVLDHGRGPKIRVYKRKRRKGSEKLTGHRQDNSFVEVLEIVGGGE
jgi:large subunit ribosomal protein L21